MMCSTMTKKVIVEHSYPVSAPVHYDCQKCLRLSVMDKTSITG
jgi:hypothetical protein